MVEQIDPTGTITTNTFNALQRCVGADRHVYRRHDGDHDEYLQRERLEILSTTDPAGNTTSYTYDSSGKLLTQTDPEGWTSTQAIQCRGHVTQVVDAAGNKDNVGYNSAGDVTSVSAGPGNAVSVMTTTLHGLRMRPRPEIRCASNPYRECRTVTRFRLRRSGQIRLIPSIQQTLNTRPTTP